MNTSPRSARRAAAPSDEVLEVQVASSRPARRASKALGFSRRLVAMTVAGAVTTTAVFAFAYTARGSDTAGASEVANATAAIPAAARLAAAESFEDRTQEVSRSATRSSISEAVADQSAKERQAALDASAESATKAQAETSAEERDRLMDEDMKLVAAQSEKLKKEAEEAARRLEEARSAVEAARRSGAYVADIASMSAEDIANLTTKGGSMPIKANYRVGAGFGSTGSWSRYHTGQDFSAPTGTPIYAAASGVVLSPTAGGWAGINVVIQHSNGGSTLYAHMSRRSVSPGQTVKAGQLIGYVGNTGRSFGSHLHFEYYKPGVTPGDVYSASDPMVFLRSLSVG